MPSNNDTSDSAGVTEGGSYDVVRDRLSALGKQLRQAAESLDARRKETFGSTELVVLGNDRVRTDNNCIPVDIAVVGGRLLFGYNVYLGLKKQTVPEDVFAYQTFERTDDGFAFHTVTDPNRLSWLTDTGFVREFNELYQYYKDARLIQIRTTETKLLAVFQTGATARDVKVLRWSVDPGGHATYIDNRGERDHVYPPSHDFEWTETSRSDHILGRHPHVNILDTVFVETVGGDLTVKVEDNTSDGQGIYSEPVDDVDQSLDDARICYAKRGSLILLKVQPRGEAERHLIFNTNTRTVVRVDAIGSSCVSLPEDHGVVYPGGYTLRTGETKLFETDVADMEFVRTIAAPNGEDNLYVFHRRSDGLYKLYPYNLIRKEVTNPISAHGYSLFNDGTLLVFRATPEPTRVHPVQLWKTPFVSAEVHEAAPNDGSLLARIGNRDLVRGISDTLTLCRLVSNQSPTRQVYDELAAACNRAIDAYFWLSEDEVGLKTLIEDVRRTAERIVDEFVKVQQLQQRAQEVMATVRREHDTLLADVRPDYLKTVDEFLGAMTTLRHHRGELITLQDTRYIDTEALSGLESQTVERFDQVSVATVAFLAGGEALAPLLTELSSLDDAIAEVSKVVDLQPVQDRLNEVTEGVNLLGDVVAGLQVDDPTVKTTILESISEVVSQTNRVRAVLDGRRRSLRSAEGSAEFAANFKLFSQSVAGALSMCDTPMACDDGLSRLLLQLEELEARFGEFDEFLPQLAEKREEVYEAFGSRKQTLLDAQQRRIHNILTAAGRILDGVKRRAKTFKSEDELNAWFAADPMVLKLREQADQLTELGDTVKADELQSQIKSTRQDALRGLRDKLDLFDDDNLIKFGKHRFSVNTQKIELTLVPRGDGLALHLMGTDFFEPVTDPDFLTTRPFWNQPVASEDANTYRAETLAASLLFAAEDPEHDLQLADLEADAMRSDALLARVRAWAADRYDEGYERGIHDADAANILAAWLTLRTSAGLLRFGARARSIASLFLATAPDLPLQAWRTTARMLGTLHQHMGPSSARQRFVRTLHEHITAYHRDAGFTDDLTVVDQAAEYLAHVLSTDTGELVFSESADALRRALRGWTDEHGGYSDFERSLGELSVADGFHVLLAYAQGVAPGLGLHANIALEAAALHLVEGKTPFRVAGGDNTTTVTGLLGQHANLSDGTLFIQLDRFTERVRAFITERMPGFRAYREQRHALLERERSRLRLDEFEPRVMTSFVRNKLINDVYLHLVGDNFAKQIGAAGAAKRTDLMGLLLLISPPGYGKTTLMEYIGARLGLTFVKVNGPALGHEVASLDPAQAPNATARQEVEKVNLAFEMGNNVLLYLDDIQHCNPEFLQKFISLCDGQRRIEGVWNGKTRTYDLRGKKFAVVMAGNPYTETGDKFQIPDMLANRADTYNLGDVLGGREDVFALSFIENALTSNPLLAPLATRAQDDVYRLIRMAQGEDVPVSDLSHDYSAVELNDIRATFKHLFACQDVLLQVNAEYIRSASMEDGYRTEPKFQLQGSYRNMAKLAEKVVPAMNEAEIRQLVSDHYQGEAQTLTTGAEANLLKLAELRGVMTDDEQARWDKIREDFQRLQVMGGDDDPAAKISGVITGVSKELQSIGQQLATPQLADMHTALRDNASLLAAAIREGHTADLGPQVQQHITTLAQSIHAAGERVVSQLATPAEVPQPVDVAELVSELAAIREALLQAPRPGSAAPLYVSNQVFETTPPPVRGASRDAMLQLMQERLAEESSKAMARNTDATLPDELQVIEMLTQGLRVAAYRHMTEEQQNAFVQELRMLVAATASDEDKASP